LLDRLKTADAQTLVCKVSDRLVPREPVAFVLWHYDPPSPDTGLAIAIFDLAALRQGVRKPIFQMLRGEALLPLRAGGTADKVAFGDFDRSGRAGWALALREEGDSVLLLYAYDPASGRFQPIVPWRRGAEGVTAEDGFRIEGEELADIAPGEITVSRCRPDPARSYGRLDLYFNSYRLVDGRFMLTDARRDEQKRLCPAS
jgi:hypothetical protein